MEEKVDNRTLVERDYNLMLGALDVIDYEIQNTELYTIHKGDSKELVNRKYSRKAHVLSNLGKVGEKSLKYILGVLYLKKFPNCSLDEFSKVLKKETMLPNLTTSDRVSDIRQKLHDYIDETGQKFHNFDFLLYAFELVDPDKYASFEYYLATSLTGDFFLQMAKDVNKNVGEEASYRDYVTYVFASSTGLDIKHPEAYFESNLNKIMKQVRETIAIAGDGFTRYRYADNNLSELDLPLNEVYRVVSLLAHYAMLIHDYHEDFNLDFDQVLARERALQYKDKFHLTEDDIEKRFSLGLLPCDDECILEPGYSTKEMIAIYQLFPNSEDFSNLIMHHIHLDDIKEANQKGLYTSDEIVESYLTYMENPYEDSETYDSFRDTYPIKKLVK